MNKSKKPIYKKWWAWLIAIFVIFILIGMFSDPPEDNIKVSNSTESASLAPEFDKKLAESDKELLKKHYEDFDTEQRTQFAEIEDKYKKINDVDKNLIKADFERMCKERDIQRKKWEEEEKEKWKQFVKENSKKLSTGEHIVGKHIAKGSYNVTFNGNGNFIAHDSNGGILINEIGGYNITKYKAILPEGSKIQLKGMSANFTPIKPTLAPYGDIDIYAGYWIVGIDITKGRYKASTSKGSGNFIVHDSNGNSKVNEVLGEIGVKEVIVDLDDNDIVDIKSLNNVKLAPEI